MQGWPRRADCDGTCPLGAASVVIISERGPGRCFFYPFARREEAEQYFKSMYFERVMFEFHYRRGVLDELDRGGMIGHAHRTIRRAAKRLELWGKASVDIGTWDMSLLENISQDMMTLLEETSGHLMGVTLQQYLSHGDEALGDRSTMVAIYTATNEKIEPEQLQGYEGDDLHHLFPLMVLHNQFQETGGHLMGVTFLKYSSHGDEALGDRSTMVAIYTATNEKIEPEQLKGYEGDDLHQLFPLMVLHNQFQVHKGRLEKYCLIMAKTLQEEKFQDKFASGDKEKTESAVQQTLGWLDRNQLAEKEEVEAKQKELEGVVNPIMKEAEARLRANSDPAYVRTSGQLRDDLVSVHLCSFVYQCELGQTEVKPALKDCPELTQGSEHNDSFFSWSLKDFVTNANFDQAECFQSTARGAFSRVLAVNVDCGSYPDEYPALFIAFRGSKQLGEWLTNVNFHPHYAPFASFEPDPQEPKTAVHRGFWLEVEAMHTWLRPMLQARLASKKFKRVVFTGHSHGGALAQAVIARIFVRCFNTELESLINEGWTAEAIQLLKAATAVCYASPEVFVIREPTDFNERLKAHIKERVIVYVQQSDLVGRLPSGLDDEGLKKICSALPSPWCYIGNAFQFDQRLRSFLAVYEDALEIYKHLALTVVFLSGSEGPGWNWKSGEYDVGAHDIPRYVTSLSSFARGEVTALVIEHDVASRPLVPVVSAV